MYKGEVNRNSNLPEGRGLLIRNHGAIYEGIFLNGHPEGICRCVEGSYSMEGFHEGFNSSGSEVYIIRFPQQENVLRGTPIFYQNGNAMFIGTLSFPNGDFVCGKFEVGGQFDGVVMEVLENQISFHKYDYGELI